MCDVALSVTAGVAVSRPDVGPELGRGQTRRNFETYLAASKLGPYQVRRQAGALGATLHFAILNRDFDSPQRIRTVQRSCPRGLFPLFQSGIGRRLRGGEVSQDLRSNFRRERTHSVLRLHARDRLVPPIARLVARDDHRGRMTGYAIREHMLTAGARLQLAERADVRLVAR